MLICCRYNVVARFHNPRHRVHPVRAVWGVHHRIHNRLPEASRRLRVFPSWTNDIRRHFPRCGRVELRDTCRERTLLEVYSDRDVWRRDDKYPSDSSTVDPQRVSLHRSAGDVYSWREDGGRFQSGDDLLCESSVCVFSDNKYTVDHRSNLYFVRLIYKTNKLHYPTTCFPVLYGLRSDG